MIGAGVAGLAAIGAAQSLGAIVRSFDVRPEVAEQIESMGAEFLMLDFSEDSSSEGGMPNLHHQNFIEKEMQLFREQAPEIDIVITTALILAVQHLSFAGRNGRLDEARLCGG